MALEIWKHKETWFIFWSWILLKLFAEFLKYSNSELYLFFKTKDPVLKIKNIPARSYPVYK